VKGGGRVKEKGLHFGVRGGGRGMRSERKRKGTQKGAGREDVVEFSENGRFLEN